MGKKFNEFSDEDKELILQFHNDGLLNREIAVQLDTSTTMVGRLLRSMNVPSRHPLLTDERKMKIKDCYEQYQNMQIVADIMHCNSGTVAQVLEEFNVKRKSIGEMRRKYDIIENYFENIDTPNKAYILGLFFSDGTVSKNGNQIAISLQARDKHLLDDINHEFAGNRKLIFLELSKKNPNWQDQYCLTISNKKLNADLRKQGVIPNKSLVLEFPKNIPDNLIHHFVRGYFDGDGSLSKFEGRCTLISTKSFCEELAKIVKDTLNVNSSIVLCHGRDDKPTRSFQIAGNRQVKKFLDWIYSDADIYLERKHSLYLSKYYNNSSLI